MPVRSVTLESTWSATSFTFSVAVFAATGDAWNALDLEANTARVLAEANAVRRDMIIIKNLSLFNKY
jgi:hypothetical protein